MLEFFAGVPPLEDLYITSRGEGDLANKIDKVLLFQLSQIRKVSKIVK